MILVKYRLFWLFIILFCLAPLFLHARERDNPDQLIRDLGGIPHERRSLLADYGGFGTSVLVNKAGQGEAPLTFVVAVPLNAGFAVETASYLARKIQSADDPGNTANILVAFLGDESRILPKDMGGVSHKGLRDLITLADMPEKWVLCYIDIDEAPGKLNVRHGISGYVAPLDIVKPLSRIFDSRGIPWFFKVMHNEIYKLGLVEGPEQLSIAWNAEINGFVLSGALKSQRANKLPFQSFFSGSDDAVSAEFLADCLYDYAGLLSGTIIKADRYYSIFALPWGKTVFMGSGLGVALLLVIAGGILFFFLFNTARLSVIMLFHVRLFFKFIWFFLILLPFMVLCVRLSGTIYSLLAGLLNSSGNAVNNTGALFAVFLALLLFVIPTPLFDYLRLPKREQFYGISAVIIVTMGLISAVLLDFSYTHVFILAFLFVFLGSLLKHPVMVYLCIILGPIFAFDAVLNIVETGSSRIAELLVTPDWKNADAWVAALIMAQFSLPFVMLMRRGNILLQKSEIINNPAARIKPELMQRRFFILRRFVVIPFLIASLLIMMVIQIIFIPAVPEPVRRYYYAENESEIKIGIDNIQFQDSRIITLRIEAGESPVRFDVSIESGTGNNLLPVYSSSIPFSRENGGRIISFLLGENPPNPLVMEIVVPRRFEGILTATALYNSWNADMDSEDEPETADYVLGLRKNIDLGNLTI